MNNITFSNVNYRITGGNYKTGHFFGPRGVIVVELAFINYLSTLRSVCYSN